MPEVKEPNSRKVIVYQKPGMISAVQKELDEYYAMANVSIGGYWSNKTHGNGLSISEKKLLLPIILDIHPEDRDFNKAVKEFYTSSMVSKIPYKTGLTLEIGLERSNKEPVGPDNMPININDFIRYRHIIHHPDVAATEAENTMLKKFYVFDPMADQLRKEMELEVKNRAMEKYLNLKDDKKKSRVVMRLLGELPSKYKTEGEFQTALKGFAETKPEMFIKAAEDKDGATKFVIESMVDAKVLRRVGEAIVTVGEGELLGHSLDEVVIEFGKESRAELITTLKIRLQEANRVKTPAVTD